MIGIEEYIPFGYERRVSRGYLVEILHVQDREIRDAIKNARLRGILIASRDGGYFQPDNSDRDGTYFDDYLRSEYSRLGEIANVLRVEQEAWCRRHPERRKDQVPGQLRLEV